MVPRIVLQPWPVGLIVTYPGSRGTLGGQGALGTPLQPLSLQGLCGKRVVIKLQMYIRAITMEEGDILRASEIFQAHEFR